MSRSRRRSGPRVKFVQPGYRYRAPAAPPTAEQRAARLPPSQVLERITRARAARDEAEAETAALIDHTVALGLAGDSPAAGVSRQAARQQYQRRHRGDAVPGHQDHAA